MQKKNRYFGKIIQFKMATSIQKAVESFFVSIVLAPLLFVFDKVVKVGDGCWH